MKHKPIEVGTRVRHLTDDVEGIVEQILPSPALPEVVVRQDAGGTVRTPMGDWQPMPSHASVNVR